MDRNFAWSLSLVFVFLLSGCAQLEVNVSLFDPNGKDRPSYEACNAVAPPPVHAPLGGQVCFASQAHGDVELFSPARRNFLNMAFAVEKGSDDIENAFKAMKNSFDAQRVTTLVIEKFSKAHDDALNAKEAALQLQSGIKSAVPAGLAARVYNNFTSSSLSKVVKSEEIAGSTVGIKPKGYMYVKGIPAQNKIDIKDTVKYNRAVLGTYTGLHYITATLPAGVEVQADKSLAAVKASHDSWNEAVGVLGSFLDVTKKLEELLSDTKRFNQAIRERIGYWYDKFGEYQNDNKHGITPLKAAQLDILAVLRARDKYVINRAEEMLSALEVIPPDMSNQVRSSLENARYLQAAQLRDVETTMVVSGADPNLPKLLVNPENWVPGFNFTNTYSVAGKSDFVLIQESLTDFRIKKVTNDPTDVANAVATAAASAFNTVARLQGIPLTVGGDGGVQAVADESQQTSVGMLKTQSRIMDNRIRAISRTKDELAGYISDRTREIEKVNSIPELNNLKSRIKGRLDGAVTKLQALTAPMPLQSHSVK